MEGKVSVLYENRVRKEGRPQKMFYCRAGERLGDWTWRTGGRGEDAVRYLLPWPLGSQGSTVIPKITKLQTDIRK